MKIGSLFAGIGGADRGFEKAGYEVVWQVELDEAKRRHLRREHPGATQFADVRDCGSHNLSRVDVIVGGFPCQDVSVAGKRVGINGKRSGLWHEMRRIISELRPRWVLVENVPNLRTKGADEVLASLEAEGYTCWPTVVGAWAVGANHKRDRVWILCHSEHDGPLAASGAGGITAAVHDHAQRAQEPRESSGAGAPGAVSFPAFRGQQQHDWESARTIEPGLGGADDGFPGELYKRRIEWLGDAIVPELAFVFAKAILAAPRSNRISDAALR